jgi:hypothetical protein
MGAANPRAAAERARDVARTLGISGLKIACIEGDDVTKFVQPDQPFMDEPGTLADIGRPVVGMNAYLGADAIIPALEAGADVVIGGRLADPSMDLAPLMRHYADRACVAGAGRVIGHLMEMEWTPEAVSPIRASRMCRISRTAAIQLPRFPPTGVP